MPLSPLRQRLSDQYEWLVWRVKGKTWSQWWEVCFVSKLDGVWTIKKTVAEPNICRLLWHKRTWLLYLLPIENNFIQSVNLCKYQFTWTNLALRFLQVCNFTFMDENIFSGLKKRLLQNRSLLQCISTVTWAHNERQQHRERVERQRSDLLPVMEHDWSGHEQRCEPFRPGSCAAFMSDYVLGVVHRSQTVHNKSPWRCIH